VNARVPRVVIACLAGVVAAQPAPAGRAQDRAGGPPTAPLPLAARLQAVRASADLPAIGGARFRSTGVLEVAVSGVRRLGDPIEVTTGDLWHIGSLTKSFTSLLIGKFVERKALSWASTLGELFGQRAGKFAPVTLVDLLSHRAGLPPTLAPAIAAEIGPVSPVAAQRKLIVDRVLQGEPASAPGERYQYSNIGFVIAGAVLEEKTGKSWEDLVQGEVLAPLKLSSAGFGAPGPPGAVLQPRGHRQPAAAGSKLIPVEPPFADNPAYLGPAGTMHLSVGDLARWGLEHLRGERGVDGLVRAETFRRLHAPPRSDASYALGWAVRREGDRRTIWHNGSNTLWYAIVAFDPEADLGVVIVTNGSINAGKAIDAAAAEILKKG
jgi:CubicO group peptidase (beta-lactamase class C family)